MGRGVEGDRRPHVNLAYTGVAKHKFPFGDLRREGRGLLPFLNALALNTTYLPGPHLRANTPLLLFHSVALF